MSVPTEFHSSLSITYHTLCISVCQPITEVKAEWNVAADVWEIGDVRFKPNLSSNDYLTSLPITNFKMFYLSQYFVKKREFLDFLK